MNFEDELKRAKYTLKEMLNLTESDMNLLQEIRGANKQLKKLINLAEEEVEKIERQIAKSQKELRRMKHSDNQENTSNALINKFKEYEDQIQQQRKLEMLKVISQIEAIYQESKKTLTIFKRSLADDSKE